MCDSYPPKILDKSQLLFCCERPTTVSICKLEGRPPLPMAVFAEWELPTISVFGREGTRRASDTPYGKRLINKQHVKMNKIATNVYLD